MATSIINDDIRLLMYDLSEYSTMEDTENSDTRIPESLNQAIISTSRPKSFISPVLLAIALYLHCKYPW